MDTALLKKKSAQKTMKNLVLFGRLFIALWFITGLLYVPSVDAQAQSCNPLCKFPHMCQADSGKCLCVVGWTGPNAVYIEGNSVLADYCSQPCFYNQYVQSSNCASTTTTTTTTPTTTTTTTTTTTPTTTTTTRSPSDLLADLTELFDNVSSLLERLKEQFQLEGQ